MRLISALGCIRNHIIIISVLQVDVWEAGKMGTVKRVMSCKIRLYSLIIAAKLKIHTFNCTIISGSTTHRTGVRLHVKLRNMDKDSKDSTHERVQLFSTVWWKPTSVLICKVCWWTVLAVPSRIRMQLMSVYSTKWLMIDERLFSCSFCPTFDFRFLVCCRFFSTSISKVNVF